MKQFGETGTIEASMSHKEHDDASLFDEYQYSRGESRLVLNMKTRLELTDKGHLQLPSAVFIAEALRQSVILYAHIAYDVAGDDAFLMERMILDISALNNHEISKAEVVTKLYKSRRGKLVTLVAEVRFETDSKLVSFGEGHLRVVPGGIYRRLRLDKRMSSDLVHHGFIPNGFSLHLEASGSGELLFDARNSLYSDHPVDHVPGMLFVGAAIEAFQRAGIGNTVGHIDAIFKEYVNLSTLCTLQFLIEREAFLASQDLLRVTFPGVDGVAVTIEIQPVLDQAGELTCPSSSTLTLSAR